MHGNLIAKQYIIIHSRLTPFNLIILNCKKENFRAGMRSLNCSELMPKILYNIFMLKSRWNKLEPFSQ